MTTSGVHLKKIKTGLAVILLLPLYLVPVVNAQQITAPTTPSTQNPQPTQTDIINNESTIQEPSDAKLLNSTNRKITIESGTPLPAPTETKPERSLTRLWLAVFGGLFAALLATILISRLVKAKDKQVGESSKEAPAPQAKGKEQPKTVSSAPKSKKHATSNSKKKKRRSNKKKR